MPETASSSSIDRKGPLCSRRMSGGLRPIRSAFEGLEELRTPSPQRKLLSGAEREEQYALGKGAKEAALRVTGEGLFGINDNGELLAVALC